MRRRRKTGITHDKVEQPSDMPVRQVLEDLNLSAQVLEQLLAQPIPVDSLDSHRRMRLLVTGQQTYTVIVSIIPSCLMTSSKAYRWTKTHFMVTSVHRCKTTLSEVAHNHIRPHLLVLDSPVKLSGPGGVGRCVRASRPLRHNRR